MQRDSLVETADGSESRGFDRSRTGHHHRQQLVNRVRTIIQPTVVPCQGRVCSFRGVAAFIKDLQADVSPPTVKQHLAALRMLFDWLVTGHVIDVNPAHAVRGPKYVVKKGKTPVLTADEARALLDSIPIRKATDQNGVIVEKPDLMGLRDRALIGLMTYSFARVGAVLQMKVGDYFVQGRRRWVRLHEKGGKEHDVPCHHNLDHFLDEYIAAAGIAGDANGYLFRTTMHRSGILTESPLHQQDAYRIIQKRAKAAGIETKIGNHTFRATGITAYLKNSGKLEVAQHIANHESPRTTKLYDRRQDEISLDSPQCITTFANLVLILDCFLMAFVHRPYVFLAKES